MVVSLSRISANSEIFADQCVLNGFVPPHPGDVERALKLISNSKIIAKDALNIVTDIDDGNQDKNTTESKDLPDLQEEELSSIISIATKSDNPLSQKTINKVHELHKNISTRDARKIIKALISKGEIQVSGDEE